MCFGDAKATVDAILAALRG
jgi:hypothetical protein